VNYLEQSDNIQYEIFLKGLSENTIRDISKDLEEPERMLQHRLNCLEIFQKSKKTNYGPNISTLNYDNIVYYAKPLHKGGRGGSDDREKVPTNIRNIFNRLQIPEAEQKYLAGVGGQYDSSVVYHKLKEKRAKI